MVKGTAMPVSNRIHYLSSTKVTLRMQEMPCFILQEKHANVEDVRSCISLAIHHFFCLFLDFSRLGELLKRVYVKMLLRIC